VLSRPEDLVERQIRCDRCERNNGGPRREERAHARGERPWRSKHEPRRVAAKHEGVEQDAGLLGEDQRDAGSSGPEPATLEQERDRPDRADENGKVEPGLERGCEERRLEQDNRGE
jgi:hypothetical protein